VPSTNGVLLIAASLGGGGAERQLVQMANHWAKRGIPVTLATVSAIDIPDFFPVHEAVHRVRVGMDLATRGRAWRLVGRLRALVKASRPRAIVSFITENNVLSLLATIGLRVRVIVSERAHPRHDTSVSRSWRALRWLLYRRAEVAVAQTGEIAAWIEQHCHARCAVIPNGLRDLPQPTEPRQQLVLGVGRLTRQKGFDLLLRAFALVRAGHPDWTVTIFGVGPERESLGTLADSLGIAASVKFAGTDPLIESWMARAGLVVQPSRFEGFPNAVLEAMGLGAPVISADCPSGPRDLITDGVDGRLVPVDDVDALAATMDSLMADASLRERLGREACRVRERFSQNRVMSLWDAIVLGDTVPGAPA
jgi:glycosyltransferase involved in cell wall biosynthesis